MSDDFPAFALSEEHEALREAVRALADDKIAPRAAEVDRTSEFPWETYEALVKADLHAVHIPSGYGGAGADAIATAIVIEEVARACASSSLIPAVNKLDHREGTGRPGRARPLLRPPRRGHHHRVRGENSRLPATRPRPHRDCRALPSLWHHDGR
jgi:Acyl-CoA dehydrogenase, N-terminal domain